MSLQIIGDFNYLLDCLNNVNHNLSIEKIADKVLLLMGETKAGKTTLLYYLLKKKLIREVNELGVTQMKPQALCFNAQIGNGYESTTVYPNIPTDVDEDECLVIDMPGFNDSRPIFRFLNIFIIRQVLKNINKLHISFVLPFQSLQGDGLLLALQNTCPLLNNTFLSKKHSFSFILTKLEDRDDDKNTFQQQMQQLKDMVVDEALSEVLNSFAERNTYTFCSSEPNLEEGARLKKQIIKENKFYPIEEGFENILSENYADIIIGKGDRQEFNDYLQKVIQQLSIYLPQLINTFTYIVKYQYQQLLAKCSDQRFDQSQFLTVIQKLTRVGFQVPSEWTSLREAIQIENDQLLLKSFASKMKQTQGVIQDQNQKIILGIKNFINYSKQLSQQQCGVSDLFRDALHIKLKDCYILIQTLNSISSKLQIQESIQSFLRSQPLNNAITAYYRYIKDSTFLAKMMQIPEARSLMHLDQQFSTIIASYDPKYIPSASEVITKIVQEKTRDKIKKKQFQKTFLESTKEARPLDLPKPDVYLLDVKDTTRQLQQLTKKIKLLPNNHYSLKFLIQSLNNMNSVKPRVFRDSKLLNALLRKSIQVLSSLSLIEEAIVFSISIPDHNQTQQLVQTGINFGLITPDFIKTILLPYISYVEYDFETVQKLHNFLLLRANSLEQILKTQEDYVDLLTKMRKDLSSGKFEYKLTRYNLQILQSLISEQNSSLLLKRAQARCQQLRKAYLCSESSQQQLAQLNNIS